MTMKSTIKKLNWGPQKTVQETNSRQRDWQHKDRRSWRASRPTLSISWHRDHNERTTSDSMRKKTLQITSKRLIRMESLVPKNKYFLPEIYFHHFLPRNPINFTIRINILLKNNLFTATKNQIKVHLQLPSKISTPSLRAAAKV